MGMRSPWRCHRWKVILLAIFGVVFMTACGDEPVRFNECGGTGTVDYDGVDTDASVGDACGECGVITCDGENTIICEDPGENDCGGCAELDAEIGETCLDAGQQGEWSCDGEDEVMCLVEDTNACGGSGDLDFEPGTPCGPCLLDSYRCSGSNEAKCEGIVGCPQARDVAASQGTRDDAVVVTWRGSIYASGYRIYRDGSAIAEVDRGALSYTDTDADPSGGPAGVDVEATTDRSDGVEVSWSTIPADAAEHEYEVEILFDEESSQLSGPATGYRGSGVDYFELSIDGQPAMNVGDSNQYFDDEALKAQVTLEVPEVADSDWDWVEMTIASPDIDTELEHEYEVVAVTSGGDSSAPGVATGYRASEDPEYFWEASVGSTGDEDFEGLDHCDGALSCTDDDFPDDVAEKYYRFGVEGEGIETEISDPVVGTVDPLVVEPDEITSAIVGEALVLGAQIETDGGDSIARQGVELEIDFPAGVDVDEPAPSSVTTDASGRAEFSVTFQQETSDVNVGWTAVDDPRVSDQMVNQGPFDVTSTQASSSETSIMEHGTATELLADGVEYTQIDIELRDGDAEAISGAGVDVEVDGPGDGNLDCDEFTDSEGLAVCTLSADEPGYYTVDLVAPTAVTLDDVGPFYATADDYPEITGEIRAAGIAGDYAVFGGFDLSYDGSTPAASVVVDRVTGQAQGELDGDFSEIDTIAVDDGDLFAIGDAKVGRYDVAGDEVLAEELGDFGELLVVEGDYVAVIDGQDRQVRTLDRDTLDEVDQKTGFLEGGTFFSAAAASDTVFVLGDDIQELGDLLNDYLFISFALPDLSSGVYLNSDDVEGGIDFFAVGDSTAHFLAGDFTEIDGVSVSGLARMDDSGVVEAGFDAQDAPDDPGGLWYYDGQVWSAGTFDAGGGGQAFDATTGDTVADTQLDNEYAWGRIVVAPRHLLLVEAAADSPSVDFEIVLRPDVDNAVVVQ